jgi:hypothetical protein
MRVCRVSSRTFANSFVVLLVQAVNLISAMSSKATDLAFWLTGIFFRMDGRVASV